MKISNSKKELAHIISENGGWKCSGDFAAQRKNDAAISFYMDKPKHNQGELVHYGDYCGSKHDMHSDVLLPNWHQTILSREEYFHLYPAPDADGWIEWKGGECPVKRGTIIDVRYRCGKENIGVSALLCEGDDGFKSGLSYKGCSRTAVDWRNDLHEMDIISYRLHNPEQSKQEFCESLARSIPEPETKPTIEQLAADYRDAKRCYEILQKSADDTKDVAEAKLAELVAAGKEIGVVLSIDNAEPELVITDWRDLRVGDEIEYLGGTDRDFIGSVGVVELIDEYEGDDFHILFRLGEIGGSDNPENWMSTRWCSKFRFIRRP